MTFARWTPRALALAMLIATGCNSCQETRELPAPVAREGHLPPAPQAATSPQPMPEPSPACAVIAGSSVEEGVAPLEVQFTAEGMCTDAPGVLTWDFGDGSPTVNDPNPTHTYDKPGTYTARVTLADDEHNARDTDEAPITVTAP